MNAAGGERRRVRPLRWPRPSGDSIDRSDAEGIWCVVSYIVQSFIKKKGSSLLLLPIAVDRGGDLMPCRLSIDPGHWRWTGSRDYLVSLCLNSSQRKNLLLLICLNFSWSFPFF
jgi:hypothetical protein